MYILLDRQIIHSNELNNTNDINCRDINRKILMYLNISYPNFDTFDIITLDIIRTANKFKSNLSMVKCDGKIYVAVS